MHLQTTRALFKRWEQYEPLVERVLYWYYPLDDLKKYDQPNLTAQLGWWRNNSNSIAPGCK
jgi:hypothetical protein